MNYVFLEKIGSICYNLFSTTKADNAEQALEQAKHFLRAGQAIQIEGNFMYCMSKIVGIEINCGGKLFKNDEGCYSHDDVIELINSVPCKDKEQKILGTSPIAAG